MTEQTSVFQAAAYMTAKRQDALLVVNDEGELTGILTDKDIAFRVVALNVDPFQTSIGSVMTYNPASVTSQDYATDALNKMIAGKFRHLPVILEPTDDSASYYFSDSFIKSGAVYSILDITKCLYDQFEKVEKTITSSRKINHYDDGYLAPHVNQLSLSHIADVLRTQMEYPDLSSLLTTESLDAPMMSLNTSVADAVLAMKAMHVTGVLCVEEGNLCGIFTTKDLVLRVIAARLDPKLTPLSRVCTPHPDFVSPETSILDSLKKMHSNRYLHLPIVKEGIIYGMVDVLKLTYHLLEHIEQMEHQNENGPLWSKFWDEESRRGSEIPSSVGNPQSSFYGYADDVDTIAPDDSASMITPGTTTTRSLVGDEDTFVFKFKDEIANKTTRFTSNIRDLESIKVFIANKIFQTYGGNFDKSSMELCYVDEDEDFVYLTSNRDLEDGVLLAKALGWKSLVIMLDRKRMNFSMKPLQSHHMRLESPTPIAKSLDMAFPIVVSGAIFVVGLYLLSRPFRIN
jgi:CBS domain-containing protein